MLINKSQLFSAGGNQELVALYLEQLNEVDVEIDINALADREPSKIISDADDWWNEILQRKVSPASLQQLKDAAVMKGGIYTAKWLYDSLTDNEQGEIYRLIFGIGGDTPFSLEHVLPNLADQLSRAAEADHDQIVTDWIDGSGSEWFLITLEVLIENQPIPKCIEADIHQLLMTIRSSLVACYENSGEAFYTSSKQQKELFIDGMFNSLLWTHGSEDIVKTLNDEYLSQKAFLDWRFDGGYIERILSGIKNKNISHELRVQFLDALLSDAHGNAARKKVFHILDGDILPDDYIHKVAQYICSKKNKYDSAELMLTSQEIDFLEKFMEDPRLDANDIKNLEMLSQEVRHKLVLRPANQYKHAKDLTELELAEELSKCTDGVVSPDSFVDSANYALLESYMDKYFTLEMTSAMRNSAKKLSAIIKAAPMSDEQILQLANALLLGRRSDFLPLFQGRKDLSDSLLRKINQNLMQYMGGKSDEISIERCTKFIYQIFISQNKIPQDIIRQHLELQLGATKLVKDGFGTWPITESPPVSMNSFIAALDYQQGDAFALLDLLLQKRPEWDLAHYSSRSQEDDWKCAEAGLVEVLVKLAMTREVYPAILSGNDLDTNKAATVLALAVRDCKIDEFDIDLLCRDENNDRFFLLANTLLNNPDFSQHHQQASEQLLAKVLKRKTDLLAPPSLSISTQRTML
ncbi:hypothetical protein [Aeromonas hydrophila]|uniref:hypothetical protein n=1 Tax=Aeromonas hydrophila TaxID=644 RepID=UPI002B4AA4C1|nr:hypothetical protein [Aeromonas hydrophila]